MEKHDLKVIEQQLSVIVSLLSKLVLAVSMNPDAPQKDQVALLSSVGLSTGVVAQIVGTSSSSVRKTMWRLHQQDE
jgi:hypothetical protein